jgi:hypothetical protein
MLRDKVTEFYVELDDFCLDFAKELSTVCFCQTTR